MRLERRRHPQRLVAPHEIVVHVMDADCVTEVFQFLGESICQSREAPHRHSHHQVLALDVARRDMGFVRLAGYDVRTGPAAFAGAVARLRRGLIAWVAVMLDELREVNFPAESSFHRFQIHAMPVRRDLNAMGESTCQVHNERLRIASRPVAVQPMRNQLSFRINRNERPNIADPERTFHFGRHVLFLGVTVGLDFVDLEAIAIQVSHRQVLIFGASLANVGQQLDDGVLGNAGHADGGTDRASFDQSRDDRDTLLDR